MLQHSKRICAVLSAASLVFAAGFGRGIHPGNRSAVPVGAAVASGVRAPIGAVGIDRRSDQQAVGGEAAIAADAAGGGGKEKPRQPVRTDGATATVRRGDTASRLDGLTHRQLASRRHFYSVALKQQPSLCLAELVGLHFVAKLQRLHTLL